MNQLENIIGHALSLFIAVPLIAFVITVLLQNKQERAIGVVVRVAKLFYIIAALAILGGWIVNGAQPINYKLATLYQTDGFVFAIQFYYDEITAVFSIVGCLLFLKNLLI